MKLFRKFIAAMLAVCTALCFVSCKKGGQTDLDKHYEDNGDYYEIKYYLPITTDGISPTFADMEEVEDAINEIVYPAINARVRFVQYSYFQYNELITPRIASNEPYDLCYTSPTINYYQTNVRRQVFLPLNTLLEDYAPHIRANVPQYAWDQATIDGHIYGVVNQQIIPRTDAVLVYSYDDLDEYIRDVQGLDGYDHTNLYEFLLDEHMHPYDFLEGYVTWLRANNRGLGGKMGQINVDLCLQTRYHYDSLGTGMMVPGVIDIDNDDFKVINQFETDEFKADIQRAARLYDSGIIPSSIKVGDYGTDMSIYDVPSLASWKPNDIRVNAEGKLGGAVRLGDPYYYIDFILGSMTAISATSENPARVMKFLDLLWTDSRILNLLCYGIEGEHYTKTGGGDDDYQIKLIDNSGYANYTMTWAYSSEFLEGVYYIDRYDTNPYKESKAINDSAYINKAIGFVFDETPIAAKIAACKSVCNTYLQEFASGQHGLSGLTNAYNEFMNRLKSAGMDEVLKEKQRQLDAWAQAVGKK